MKKSWTKSTRPSVLVALLASAFSASVFGAEVSVKSYAEHARGTIVYHYTIVNNTSHPISAVRIGHLYSNTESSIPVDQRELTVLPVGLEDLEEGVPATSKTSPSGWKDEVGAEEENEKFWFGWEVGPENQRGVYGHESLDGFSIAVPQADAPYLKGHFSVTFMSGPLAVFSGRIEPLDTLPPTISLTMNPSVLWPPNGKWTTIAANLSTRDDYDPNPEVKLESVTANETLGTKDIAEAEYGTDDRRISRAAKREASSKTSRIYTITYSATDASGNRATASAVVTVPHANQQK
jgi:hypothetical protein